MGIIVSKSRKLLKVGGIGMLILMCLISTIPVDSSHRKKKSSITSKGDAPETIIVAQDRQRTRVFLDILKKSTLIPFTVHHARQLFCELKSVEIESLFVNAYQRKVFYVFAFSTVP